ncbi:C40 family peptidase [Ammoniphilus sp. CFH 90114]|uniref:C40 family peptidase n=1 Tax=Ammoniphilus sp. CFH 90114 TaxID=2493665 RepID=UPI00100EF671|nr:NlpC/P60 family protein [Ammoniphilus sp. CFH 90114]RXT02319.1 gamma-glutamyl hydrolase [Ammoniphilus sp. CFH 90114]
MKKKIMTKILLASTMVWTSLTGITTASTFGNDLVTEARKYIGYDITKYDTSYLITYVYKQQGLTLPTGLKALSNEGTLINKKDLQVGDVVFFGSSVNNMIAVGFYEGNDRVILSYKPYKKVQYLDLNSTIAKNNYLGAKRIVPEQPKVEAPTPPPPVIPEPTTDSTIRQNIVDAGLKYLGTRYEYGSTRATKDSMDCSEFVMWAYRDGANIDFGRGGASSQLKYVKANGTYTTKMDELKVGDIMFFMSYKGFRSSDYEGIDVSKQSVGHSGIYMGNGKVLHTYSKDSGGVRIDDVAGRHWEWRFIGGGSPLK